MSAGNWHPNQKSEVVKFPTMLHDCSEQLATRNNKIKLKQATTHTKALQLTLNDSYSF